MKLLPGLFNNHFDDFFNDSFFTHNSNVMKTDIQVELNDGYLRVHASRNTSNEEKDEKGNIVRQERYSGSCERSFYVGDDVKEDEIMAKFENGELKITVLKQYMKQINEKQYIPIK